MTPRYAVDVPSARVAVALDGYQLVFHRPSGTTHILASPAPEVIDALAAGPATLDELAARLAAAHDLAAEDGMAQTLSARLDELIEIGLVRRA